MDGTGAGNINRVGFHYYPDSLHYTEKDLLAWLPELQNLNAGWLVVHAHPRRAIPEYFIRSLISANIQPIIHVDMELGTPIPPAEMMPILDAYAHWGVKNLVFFERPNCISSWPNSSWAQQDLVDRFLDRWLPLANTALQHGLTPILPPLEPGGNFWDTIFLRTTLQGLEKRKQNSILQSMTLSAYAWTFNRALNWGQGGPQMWPDSHPYFTPENGQDQLGFRTFEWYEAISQAVLSRECPIFLFQAGRVGDGCEQKPDGSNQVSASDTASQIMDLLSGKTNETTEQSSSKPAIPDYVQAASFWLLCSEPESQFEKDVWFNAVHEAQAPVLALRKRSQDIEKKSPAVKAEPAISAPTINHYLLLPSFEWGVADWHLEAIKPYIKKHQPTIGFSIQEAARAKKVTVVGGMESFSGEAMTYLRQCGCLVEEISGDGTSIATILAER
ncbi:MAG: hypothetical protein HGA86_01780 [Anaerolineaceae bacterium]|nr:hypothetical protein [Anaerolineaceae bacterium]